MKTRKLRFFIIFLSGLLLFWYLIPLVFHGIINIGNVTGILIFLTVILCVFFAGQIHSFFRHHSSPLFKVLYTTGIAIISFVLILVLLLSFFMFSACQHKPVEPTTLVVLGCQNGSRMMHSRTDTATDYLLMHPDVSCILSGGAGSDEDIPEGEYMFHILVDNGIEPSRLYIENSSTSTRENLSYSFQLAQASGLNGNFSIVTNEFHEFRAFLAAKKLGIQTGSVPAVTPWWLFPTFYTRELYGILYELLL